MAKYAYIDRGGILHIVEKPKTAREYAAGPVIPTHHTAAHGFPTIDGEQVIVYSETVMKHDANGEAMEPSPELVALYRSCKG